MLKSKIIVLKIDQRPNKLDTKDNAMEWSNQMCCYWLHELFVASKVIIIIKGVGQYKNSLINSSFTDMFRFCCIDRLLYS